MTRVQKEPEEINKEKEARGRTRKDRETND
jgi:hypothetical protein